MRSFPELCAFAMSLAPPVHPLRDKVVSNFRTIVLTLAYNDAIDHVGIETRSRTVIHVDFFVGLATVRIQDSRMSVVVTTRNILTRIGVNYVVIHDTTDAQQENQVVPTVGISLHNVPATAVSAGVHFDEIDVIPVDAVVGSVAFFEDDPVYTNPYPCLYRPDAASYDDFSAAFGCSNSIQRVSVCLSVSGGVRVRRCANTIRISKN